MMGTVAAAPDDITVGRNKPLIHWCIKDLIEAPRGPTGFQSPRHLVDTLISFVV